MTRQVEGEAPTWVQTLIVWAVFLLFFWAALFQESVDRLP